MPKLKKNKKQSRQEELKALEQQKTRAKKIMLSSSIITYVIALVALILSFMINGKYWDIPEIGKETTAEVIDVLVKSFIILVFFFFALISVANFQEIRGYVFTWREMIVLLIVTLLQSSTELYVFLVAASGVVLIITYMYFIQGRIQKE